MLIHSSRAHTMGFATFSILYLSLSDLLHMFKFQCWTKTGQILIAWHFNVACLLAPKTCASNTLAPLCDCAMNTQSSDRRSTIVATLLSAHRS